LLRAVKWLLLFGVKYRRILKMKRTYQPHKIRRIRTHGFRARMKTVGGRKVLNNRRRKGRALITVTIYKK